MLQIDKLSGIPVYEQVIEQIQQMIILGSLKPDEQIPSVRSLSMELSINPNTLQKAYTDLENRGITYSVPGVGRYVSKDAKKKLQSDYAEKLEDLYDAVFKLAIANIDEDEVIAVISRAYQSAKSYMEKRDER